MAITEESRHHLFQRLDQILGPEDAATLMEHLPPVGWADVATKRDLDHQAIVTKRDLDLLGAELRADIAGLRTELHSEIAGLRTELHSEIAGLRTELHSVQTRLLRYLVASQLAVVGVVGTLVGVFA